MRIERSADIAYCRHTNFNQSYPIRQTRRRRRRHRRTCVHSLANAQICGPSFRASESSTPPLRSVCGCGAVRCRAVTTLINSFGLLAAVGGVSRAYQIRSASLLFCVSWWSLEKPQIQRRHMRWHHHQNFNVYTSCRLEKLIRSTYMIECAQVPAVTLHSEKWEAYYSTCFIGIHK